MTVQAPATKTISTPKGDQFTVPVGWSDNAAYIAATKYARVVDGERESSIYAIADRISEAIWTPGTHNQTMIWKGIVDQRFAFNSPVWFNLGVRQNPQLSACFILSIPDDLMGIIEWWGTSAQIFSGGSGMGADLSTLRERGALVGGDGTSSGPLSFGKVADAIGQVTKSGGITRRAATMLTLKDWHPDILEFISKKRDAERLILKLKQSGVDVSLNSEVYDLIAHQQANRAVRLSDDFMELASNPRLFGAWWPFKFHTPPPEFSAESGIEAYRMLDLIAECCWECGDPGVQFEDTIQRWHTIPAAGPINSSNPCSEYMSIDDSSCNLASINLTKFYSPHHQQFALYPSDDSPYSGYGGLLGTVELLVESMDRIVDFASYPTGQIAANTRNYRQLGLGFTNLGGLLMSMGLPYDSTQGRAIAAALMALITGQGYLASSKLARQYGSYMDDEPKNAEATWRVIDKHRVAMVNLIGELRAFAETDGYPYWSQLADCLEQTVEWLENLVEQKQPVRNSQISVIAPTGTISFVMDAATTGIEPAYSITYEKELAADNTRLTVPLGSVEPGLRALGYDEATIRDIVDRKVPQLGVVSPFVRPEHRAVFATAVDPVAGNFVSPSGHIRMLAAVQPFVSGAISKTVNLPHTATVRDFKEAIVQSWQSGIKAVAFYRDGSKGAQPIKNVEVMLCGECGSALVQTGTCWTCPNCGESLGACGL